MIDEKVNYIIDIIHIGYIILMNFLQLLFLYITKKESTISGAFFVGVIN